MNTSNHIRRRFRAAPERGRATAPHRLSLSPRGSSFFFWVQLQQNSNRWVAVVLVVVVYKAVEKIKKEESTHSSAPVVVVVASVVMIMMMRTLLFLPRRASRQKERLWRRFAAVIVGGRDGRWARLVGLCVHHVCKTSIGSVRNSSEYAPPPKKEKEKCLCRISAVSKLRHNLSGNK
ncbi:hypothetical protein LZ30DRAFT_381542 [Colletotrichum cereale]|nr:hypothetical protein LZ30DRAFT_381542 [Colletotrichum cereale]